MNENIIKRPLIRITRMNFISTLILPLRVVLPQAVSNLSLTSESGSSSEAVSHAKQLLGSLMPNRGHNHGDIDKEHKFWSTQPVLSLSETLQIEESGPIDVQKSVGDVKNEEYNMPAGFKWVSIDIEDPNELQEVYNLLNENYVEDDDNMFRFDYSKPFLQWALTPPGYIKDWHVGVRSIKTNALLACITGTNESYPSTYHFFTLLILSSFHIESWINW